MMQTTYQIEVERQQALNDVPAGHLPVHRWYLRIDDLSTIPNRSLETEDALSFKKYNEISVDLYRSIYHPAGENWLWGDRRRLSDEDLDAIINHPQNTVTVLFVGEAAAGFYELSDRSPDHTEVKYFALLPDYTGKGLGRHMLTDALKDAASRGLPIIIDTCSLDHPAALENYRKSGFSVYREKDFFYPDPRLDGTINPSAGAHVPLAKS